MCPPYSGQERLEIVKQFCNYGLEHWGSDDKGVENTRKFLLGTNTIITYSVCVEGREDSVFLN